MYPVAMEGALKLKEISYIHAEAYPAGELKHGPSGARGRRYAGHRRRAKQRIIGKAEVQSGGSQGTQGQALRLCRSEYRHESANNVAAIETLSVDDLIAPIVYTVPLQLLAYHVAVLKGADVDQPRNLAKSVTVE